MSFTLISEAWPEPGQPAMRTTVVEGEVSGVLSGPSKAFLVVACPRAFPAGAKVRFQWQRESGLALVEDCIQHDGGYVVWLEVRRAARWLAHCTLM